MIHFLHTFQPEPVLFTLGPINLYWYGFFIVLGIIAALATTFLLAKYHNIKTDTVFDLSLWLIIGGIAGARVYDIILELPYYLQNPLQTLAVWQGGLAIHGGIIAGIIITWFFAKKHRINFWRLTALTVPGLAIAQAIGRWGNYFNQELFGLPTALPWGIPIDLWHRPWQYSSSLYFQPTFLYESLGCLAIGLILVVLNICFLKKQKLNAYFYIWSTALFMILYSILRFSLEFIRSDKTPYLFGLRWPQIVSLAIIILFSLILIYYARRQKK
ncbi:MAG: prolipoprotein diacylglyceryl transferase [Patescibacteria group bacterium]